MPLLTESEGPKWSGKTNEAEGSKHKNQRGIIFETDGPKKRGIGSGVEGPMKPKVLLLLP